MSTATSAPIEGSSTLGVVTFTWDIPAGPDGQYDTSAVVTISVGAVQGQANFFTPTNPNWQASGIMIGNDVVAVNMTYAAPTAASLGSLTVNSGSVSVNGQQPQSLGSAMLVDWSTSGPV